MDLVQGRVNPWSSGFHHCFIDILLTWIGPSINTNIYLVLFFSYVDFFIKSSRGRGPGALFGPTVSDYVTVELKEWHCWLV